MKTPQDFEFIATKADPLDYLAHHDGLMGAFGAIQRALQESVQAVELANQEAKRLRDRNTWLEAALKAAGAKVPR